MREIEPTKQFRRDYKREAKGQRRASLASDLNTVLSALTADLPLAAHHHDHPLGGTWKGFRDCHVRPDLILIYRKKGKDVLSLVRLGSHSELSL